MIYDKRKLKRHDIFLIVEFKPLKSPGGFSIGITRDLSPDGFSLEAQNIECRRGDIMEFRLKHPAADWTVDISGEVIWKNHSWYKYIIGIKFLKVNEEQSSKILKLMSAVKDEADKPGPDSKNPEIIQETGKVKHPDPVLSASVIVNPLPDAQLTKFSHVSLRGVEYCELTGTERTFITSDVIGIKFADGSEEVRPAEDRAVSDKVIEAAPAKDQESIPETAQVPADDKAGYTAQAPYLNDINPAENNHKKKLWLYIPFVMVVIIIFVIALPVMIKRFNHAPADSTTVATESPYSDDVEKDMDVPAPDNVQISSENLNVPSVPLPMQQAETQDSIPREKDKAINSRQASAVKDSSGIPTPSPIVSAEVKGKKTEDAAPPVEAGRTLKNTSQPNNAKVLMPETDTAKPLPDNADKSRKTDLIAKVEDTFKNLRALQSEKPEETEVIISAEKTPEVKPLVKTEVLPVPPEVVRPEETPVPAAVTAVAESERPPVFKLQPKAPEEKKGDIKKAEQYVRKPGMPNVVLLVKRDNSRSSLNNSPATPSITTADLLNKWKHIGSTRSGAPLFIAPDSISYPREHVVNLLVKASVNKKDFIDLLAINCSQIKLRILEERTGNNPVFSSYSAEWRDIIPDSMILYNSACPEKR